MKVKGILELHEKPASKDGKYAASVEGVIVSGQLIWHFEPVKGSGLKHGSEVELDLEPFKPVAIFGKLCQKVVLTA